MIFKVFLKEALWKAVAACLLFFVLDHFQSIDFIRENIENPAFDSFKWKIKSEDQALKNKTPVTVFTFDNKYMKEKGLYDNEDNPKYGYILPREHVVNFISELDKRLDEKNTGSPKFCPKALFIDLDLSFPSSGIIDNKKPLGNADQKLINILKKDHCYKILLAKTDVYNFIESSTDPDLQKLIVKNKKIIPKDAKIFFVSPFIHLNNDGEVRRYKPTAAIGLKTDTTKIEYPSAAHALWKIINNQAINIDQIKTDFPNYVDARRDTSKETARVTVNSTNIWIKNYQAEEGLGETDEKCTRCYSHWSSLEKYSLSYKLSSIFTESFTDSIIILGSTYKPNQIYHNGEGDYYKIPELIGDTSVSGVDIHANTLMTLLFLDQNKPMQAVSLLLSLLIIFISFFLIDLIVSILFKLAGKSNTKIELFVALIINIVVLYQISKYFLFQSPPLWFNWIIPLILIEAVEFIILVRKYLPMLFHKLKRSI